MNGQFGVKYIRDFEHIIIDTQARPTKEDLEELADSCDLLILPTTPKALDLDALLRTVDTLKNMQANFKVLLEIVPPAPSQSGKEAKEGYGTDSCKNGPHLLKAF